MKSVILGLLLVLGTGLAFAGPAPAGVPTPSATPTNTNNYNQAVSGVGGGGQGNLSNATGTTSLPSAGYPAANYYNHNGSWSYPAPWQPGAGGWYNY